LQDLIIELSIMKIYEFFIRFYLLLFELSATFFLQGLERCRNKAFQPEVVVLYFDG